jgi:hypothetical protein
MEITSENVESPIFKSLKRAISVKLDPPAANRIDPRGYRLQEVGRFLSELRDLNIPARDLGRVIGEIRSVIAGSYVGVFDQPERDRRFSELSGGERGKLQGHLDGLVAKVKTEFPELLEQFPEQFS